MIKKGAICAKEDKMKKLLATFAVTALLVILAVSAVSCVYQPDGDRTIDYGALGEPVFADEFDTFDTDTWWSGDVIESAYYDDPKMGEKYKDTAFHTIHAQGYGDEHKSKQSPYYEVESGVYDSFNTYGVYWDGEGYKFFVNGMLTRETDFCPSGAAEYLELSVEIAGEYGSGNPANPDNEFTWGGEITSNEGGKDFVSEFVIDYVRCYDVDEIPFVK